MFNLNYQVSGSDSQEGEATKRLRDLGITIFIGHSEKQIAGADAVVTSSAVENENPEVMAAKARGVPVVPRAMMLVELMRLKQGIAVAGTHGKTTTTSLIASILAEADFDPTYVIGGRLATAKENAKLGTGEFIVVEADESDASFLFLQPVIAVVTNIDFDHMGTYGNDFQNLEKAFFQLIQRLPFYGVAVLCGDDDSVQHLLSKVSKSFITYGLTSDCDVYGSELREDGTSMLFKVRMNGKNERGVREFRVNLNLAGKHNVQNALAAIAVCSEVGVEDVAICRALENFEGVSRRFQVHGTITTKENREFTLIDDYGHHPREIESTLNATRGAFPGSRIILIFQPHRYTRTRDCFEDFVRVLSSADVLLLTEVFSAGEGPIVAADGRSLSRAVRLNGRTEPFFIDNLQALPQVVLNLVRSGDVVLNMGAGSISTLPDLIMEAVYQ